MEVMDVDKTDTATVGLSNVDSSSEVALHSEESALREGRAHLSFERTCSTVLHQSHLLPLPTFSHPVMWDYDQAMWLLQVRSGLPLSLSL